VPNGKPNILVICFSVDQAVAKLQAFLAQD
jgi:hypothetical protein